MIKLVITVLVLGMSAFNAAAALAVDCDQVFTRLERAICANPELIALDRELERLSDIAVEQNILSRQAISELRNDLALRCGHADEVEACLIDKEQERVLQLSMQIDENALAGDFNDGRFKVLGLLKALRSRVEQAEQHYRKTGQVGDLIEATLDILGFYSAESEFLVTAVKEYEVRALQAKVKGGCHDLRLRRFWRHALRVRGQSCEDSIRLSVLG